MGKCDLCDDGFLRNSARLCEACTSNCRKCYHTGPDGCYECFWWHSLQPDGSCAFNWIKGTVAFVCAVIALNFARIYCVKRNQSSSSTARRLVVMGQQDYIDQAPSARALLGESETSVEMPSGPWKGYYTFSGTSHDVCTFSLEFMADQTMRGDGIDDVGRYTIAGIFAPSRIAFSKKYVARSQNVAGVVSYGNKGHVVEYRGELAGDSLGHGFRGDWTIRDTLGNHDGRFHIWPAMEGWTDAGTSAAAGAGRGNVFEESECVICYDRKISTCLRPCGHVALCGICSGRLHPKICPLCRQPITAIERYSAAAPENSDHRD